MAVESSFEFRFPAEAHEEGREIAARIGADMPALNGFVDYQVTRDVADPGHLVVVTGWDTQASAEAVLAAYAGDQKVSRATELMGAPPVGFVGERLEP